MYRCGNQDGEECGWTENSRPPRTKQYAVTDCAAPARTSETRKRNYKHGKIRSRPYLALAYDIGYASCARDIGSGCNVAAGQHNVRSALSESTAEKIIRKIEKREALTVVRSERSISRGIGENSGRHTSSRGLLFTHKHILTMIAATIPSQPFLQVARTDPTSLAKLTPGDQRCLSTRPHATFEVGADNASGSGFTSWTDAGG